jgi:hypothetical protein
VVNTIYHKDLFIFEAIKPIRYLLAEKMGDGVLLLSLHFLPQMVVQIWALT